MATFPINPQPGAQMQSVPGGSASMNLSPLGSSPLTTVQKESPIAATLPTITSGVPGVTQGGLSTNPGLTISAPGGLLGPGSTVPSSAGGYNPAAGVTNLGASTSGSGLGHTLMGDLQSTYGRGTGTAIGNILGSLGTTTSQALQTTEQTALDAANRQWANMQAGMGMRGVSADSSTAALAAGDFSSQVNQSLQQTAADIGLREEETLLAALTGEGKLHGGDTSWMGTMNQVLGMAGNVAGAVSEGFGVGGVLGKGLDVLSNL